MAKQMCINRLPLPEDICREIKNACFYDSITGRTRLAKKEIIKNIKNAISGRFMSELLVDVDEKVLFMFIAGDREECNLTKIVRRLTSFCETCGNYKSLTTIREHMTMPEDVSCSCIRALIEIE